MVEKKVLSEQVKEQILAAILSGEFRPGERLVESALAKRYGVSQAPVREALKSLQSMHLVQMEPYKGTVVRKFTKKDLEEFFVVRSALEGLAGRLAATNATEEDIAELQQILDDMVRAAQNGESETRFELNTRFHRKLIEASKNSLLIETAETLRLNSWSKVTGSHSRMDPENITTRHSEFIKLLKARDAEGMEACMIKHVQQSLDNFRPDGLLLYEEDETRTAP